MHDMPNYRSFRWTLDIPGIPAFVMRKIEMTSGDQMKVSFHYIDGMEIGKSPIPVVFHSDQDHDACLKLLDPEGNVIRKMEFKFCVQDYVPMLELDYQSSDYVLGQVTLLIQGPTRWS